MRDRRMKRNGRNEDGKEKKKRIKERYKEGGKEGKGGDNKMV